MQLMHSVSVRFRKQILLKKEFRITWRKFQLGEKVVIPLWANRAGTFISTNWAEKAHVIAVKF